MVVNVSSTTDRLILYITVVPRLSSCIKFADFNTLKWPERVDFASGKCSAISPAVMDFFLRSFIIFLRLESAKALNTLSLIVISLFRQSPKYYNSYILGYFYVK